MKNNFKNYIKLSVLLLVMLTITFSCQKDDEATTEQSQVTVFFSKTSLKQAKHSYRIGNLLQDYSFTPKGVSNRTATEFENDFAVDTTSVKYIEGPVSHSYTFNLQNNEADSTLIQNLVLAKHNDSENYIALMVTYQLTISELEQINNDDYPLSYTNTPEIELIEDFNPNSLGIASRETLCNVFTTTVTIETGLDCLHPEDQAAHQINGYCGHPIEIEITTVDVGACSTGYDGGNNTDGTSGGSGGGGGGIDWGGNPDVDEDPNTDILTKGPLTQINTPTRSLVREELEDVLDEEDLSFLYNYPDVEDAFNYLLMTENSEQNHAFIDWAIDYLQYMYLRGDLLGQQDQLDLFNSIVDQYTDAEIINDLKFHEIADEAIANGAEVDYEEQIIKDPSLPTCVKNIIDALIADNAFLDLSDMDSSVLEQLNLSGFIMDLFNNSNKYNLTFKMDNLAPDANGNLKNAQTLPVPSTSLPGNFDITITLDTLYVTNATDLAIARTIIHESLHAYLVYITQEDFISTMAQRLISLSISLNNDVNEAQHIEMVNNFVNAIANSLENWHNSALTDNQYYNYLSWSGAMIGTTAFSEQTTTFQTNSINANIAEGNAGSTGVSTSNAQGVNNSNCP